MSFISEHSYANIVKKSTNLNCINAFKKPRFKRAGFHSHEITIENRNYHVYQIPGNGDCFFSSLSLAINGNFLKAYEYRRVICGHIVKNWPLWENKIHMQHSPNMTCDKYTNDMGTKGPLQLKLE